MAFTIWSPLTFVSLSSACPLVRTLSGLAGLLILTPYSWARWGSHQSPLNPVQNTFFLCVWFSDGPQWTPQVHATLTGKSVGEKSELLNLL